MEMRHCLSGIWAIIRDDPVAAVVETVLGGDARSQGEGIGHHVPIGATDFT
jgi:hypothetical protein